MIRYQYCELVNIGSEEGIVFVELKHKKTGLIAKTFLASHVLDVPNYLNEEELKESIKELEEKARAEGNKIEPRIYLLEIQEDLIKIYKEYV